MRCQGTADRRDFDDTTQGRGYATEAARACAAWGFATLDVGRVTAMIHHGNEASVRVAERLGFSPSREDLLRGCPVTVYALDRPAGEPSSGAGT
ncbi:GNAT family N-acetyltransferase [Streptomyces jumonjinensis]|uniref:GNAT family N-acetyltransferase n=1 Tax=Streptomyces jumonjinensis TaxID=1945 RepID=UPI0037997358